MNIFIWHIYSWIPEYTHRWNLRDSHIVWHLNTWFTAEPRKHHKY